MADVATADAAFPNPTKKGRTKKPLNPRNSSQNDANIVTGVISPPPLVPENSAGKENSTGPKSQKIKKSTKGGKKLQQPETEQSLLVPEKSAEKENPQSLSPAKPEKTKKSTKGGKKQQQMQADPPPSSFEKELLEMQEKLQKMTLEKQQTEELLKMKEEELESRDKEQEKLHMELKKLQKLKEFKPTMTLPILHVPKDKDQEKRKKGCPETKRPATPYAMWCKQHWNEAKKENPEAEFKDVSNILGTKWKSLSAEEKKPYEERYQTEKETYLKVIGNEKRENEAMKLLEEEQKQKTAMALLEQYLQFKQEAENETQNKKTKKEKDPAKPKRPPSTYFLFMNERRAALVAESKNVTEVARITGEEWNKMTEEQKARYEEDARKYKEEYTQQMEAYKQKKEAEAENAKKEEEELMKIQKQEALQLLKKKEKTENIIKKTKEKKNKEKEEKKSKKIDDPNKPKRPASSFILFSKEARKSLLAEKPGITNAQLTALISVKWKELSEEEKEKWNGEAAEAMEAYKKELEAYNKSVAELSNNNQQQ